jgi:2-alkenal reductase
LSVLRTGKQQDINVTLEARPARQIAQSPSGSPAQVHTTVWLGISGGTLTPEIAQAMKLNSDQSGVLVVTVASGSPADLAGLKGSDRDEIIAGQTVPVGGDVITAIDGKSIGSMNDQGMTLQSYQPGDTVTLSLLRGGQPLDITVTLAERPVTQ